MKRVKYSGLVPENSFLGSFMKHMDPLETPHAYDFWAGVWVLSSVVGRSIIVNRPMAPVYLNEFVLFVAESGITRKSTAVREAVGVVRKHIPTNQLIEAKCTPELLENRLHVQSADGNQSRVVICISELVTFLGREKYNETMPTLLTDLYDCPTVRRGGGSLSRGEVELHNVFVSFLSASTPAWLLRAVNPDVIEGGFTSRVIFVCAENPKRRTPWPAQLKDEILETAQEQLGAIVERSKSISEIGLSEGARRAFAAWYKSRPLYRDPFRSSFQSREDAHILRLAALLCINDGLWVIHSTHIKAAIKVITEVREDGAAIFEGTGSNSKIIMGIDKLRDKLLAAGINGLPQAELTNAVQNFMKADVMRAVLEVMHALDMVQRFEPAQMGRGRPITIWRGTAQLAQSRAIDEIVKAYEP